MNQRLTRQLQQRPWTVLGLVLTLAGAGFGGIGVTVAGERYEVQLLQRVAQETRSCDAVYARLYGDKLTEWNGGDE